nr:hypothetical protein [Halapricum sp. CBA1109]
MRPAQNIEVPISPVWGADVSREELLVLEVEVYLVDEPLAVEEATDRHFDALDLPL